MKASGIVLVGVAVGIVACLVLMVGMGLIASPESSTDDDLIEQARLLAGKSGSGQSAQALLPPDGGENFKIPKLEVETDAYDIGLIANEGLASGEVKVYNRGEAPLVISKVTTSCQCTLGTMRDNVIPPGGESVLQVTVNPMRIRGFASMKLLTIFSNDPNNQNQKVTVKARVEPEYELDPPEMDFGVVSRGEAKTFEVTLRQLKTDSLTVTDGEIVQNERTFGFAFEEKPESQWASPDNPEYRITGQILPGSPSGSWASQLRLTTNLKRFREIRIPMEVTVEGLYTFDPPVVTVRNAEVGQAYTGVMTIRGRVPFEVLGVTGANEQLSVSYRAGEKPGTVAFDLTLSEGPEEGNLLRDVWEVKIRAQDQEFTESVRVLVVLAGAPAAPDKAQTDAPKESTGGM